MDGQFGVGNWQNVTFQGANINALFSPTNCEIMIDGSADKDIGMSNFMAANQVAAQNWVTNGGHIWCNSSGWFNDVPCGFGGVVLFLGPGGCGNCANGTPTASITPGQNAHPIFNGPNLPVGTNWTGNYFGHDVVNGPGGTQLVTGVGGNTKVFTEATYGGGKCMFTGTTIWFVGANNPQPQSTNLRKNVYAYLIPCQPPCANKFAPPNLATIVHCNDSMRWNKVPAAFGYRVYLGTNNPPTNILNGLQLANPNDTGYAFPQLQPGTTYYWQIIPYNASGPSIGCSVFSFSTEIAPVAPGPIIGTTNVCEFSNALYSINSVPGASNYFWTVPTGAVINSGQNSTSIDVTFGNQSGNICVQAFNTCDTSAFTCSPIIVSALPTQSAAGPDQRVCALTTTLAGSVPNFGTGVWSQLTGPGTVSFAAPNSPTSVASASVYGTYTFEWNIMSGSCSTTDTVMVSFDQAPLPADAGVDRAVCGLSTTMAGNTANIGMGNWTANGPGTITFGTPSSSTSIATASAYGTYSITWTITNGACVTMDSLMLTFDPAPSTPLAGPDQSICGLAGMMAGNVPVSGTASWQTVAGPGTLTFAAPSSPTSNVSASNYGNYWVVWNMANGACSLSDTIQLSFFQMPAVANAGVDQHFCGFTGTLTGNTPSVGTGTWTATGPGTIIFSPQTSPTSSITVDTYGVYSVVWTIQNGACVTMDTVMVTFDEMPQPANAGSNQDICGLLANLTGSSPSVGTGQWSMISGAGNPGFGNANNQNTTFSPASYGSYVLRWTVTNGACVSWDDVTITFDQLPAPADAGVDDSICTPDNIMRAVAANAGKGHWEVVNGTGTFADVSDANTYVSGLTIGPNTFRWTVTNGVCPPSFDDVIIVYVDPASLAADFEFSPAAGVFAGDLITFTDKSQGARNWNWNFGDGTEEGTKDATHTFSHEGAFQVMLTVHNGADCVDTLSKWIKVEDKVLVPNVFSPDGDGNNDLYIIKAGSMKEYSLVIFNRFGNEVFNSTDPNEPWDGKTKMGEAPAGTYYFILKAISLSDKDFSQKGFITLIRK
jgi:gliding motility-associated-like protein